MTDKVIFNIDEASIEAIVQSPTTVRSEDNAALVSQAEGNKLVVDVALEYDISPQESFLAIAVICQKGGTSKRAQGNIFAVLNDNKKIDLAMIRAVEKKSGTKFTLRQFARTYATFIHKISYKFALAGDLAKKISRKYPNLSAKDCIWLSNFQMDNEDCPQVLRGYIMEHFKDLFPNSTKMIP